MERINIVDNYLPENIFLPLREMMESPEFPWYYNDSIVNKNDLNKYQFTHTFFNLFHEVFSSPYYNLITPILDKINTKNLFRVKANLNVKTLTHEEGGYHIDMENITTSILYLNTNNGWTQIKGGAKISCVENRFVTFNSNLMHSGYSCTDQERKLVINFNYGKN